MSLKVIFHPHRRCLSHTVLLLLHKHRRLLRCHHFRRLYSDTPKIWPCRQRPKSSRSHSCFHGSFHWYNPWTSCSRHFWGSFPMALWKLLDNIIFYCNGRRCWFILTRTWGMKNPLKLSRNFKMHMRFYLTIKRKAYDDELRREELLNYFRRFQTTLQKNGEHGFFASEFAHSEAESEDPFEESKRIACKRCGSFHVWVHTNKSKSRARWCQLKYGHFGTAKTFIRQRMEMDGSSNRPNRSFSDYCRRLILLRLMFVQTGRYIMLLNGIFICQEMRCAANTHKPSFQVNTSLSSKQNTGKGSNSGQRMPASNMEETMTQEEFFQWLQNAVQAGVFYYFSSAESLSSRASKNGGAGSSSGGKRKKKGKKKW